MAAVDENFRSLLVATIADDAVPVEQDKVDESRPAVRVWYQRRNERTETHLDGDDALTRARFDLEVHALDIAEAQALATAIKRNATAGGLNAYRGEMGDQDVLGVFVEDQDDDYQPKGLDDDEGYHLAALSIQVIT